LPSPRWPKSTSRTPGKATLERRVGRSDEAGDCRDRQRDVVLDVGAFEALGERDRFAQVPHRLRLLEARGDRRVVDQAALQRCLQQALEQCCGVLGALGIGLFEQHGPGRRRERLAQRREVLAHELERQRVHHLEAGQPGAETGLRQLQQLDGRLQCRDAGERGGRRAG
jgi:hypothetical protein